MNKIKIIEQHLKDGWTVQADLDDYIVFSRYKPINKQWAWAFVIFGILVPLLWLVPLGMLAYSRLSKKEMVIKHVGNSDD